MFGFLIPRNYTEALEFEKKLITTVDGLMPQSLKWTQYIHMNCSESMKRPSMTNKRSDECTRYQKIRVHLFFAVKYDGRHKARLVADGHLTPEPVESIYSGVVSLRNLRLVIFLGKLYNLEIWGADIGNAYLEAGTDEKLYIVAGPEFEDWEGYILTFSKHSMDKNHMAKDGQKLFMIYQEIQVFNLQKMIKVYG